MIIAPPDLVPRPGHRVVVVPRAPLLSLVRRAAAVICDGGDTRAGGDIAAADHLEALSNAHTLTRSDNA